MPYFFEVRNVNMSESFEAPRFDSISHFLQSGGFDYRIYDMGRKVALLSHNEFKQIESQQQLYPYPFQRKASLALLLWQQDNSSINDINEPVIWFLQFPIDELGYLQQESRDGFLLGLLEQAGKNIESTLKGLIKSDDMSESPFAFKPVEERLAMLHALATLELGQQPSHYYQATREYLKGSLGYEQWQFLGLQGIADVVARLGGTDNEELLDSALPQLPEVPLESICLMLENTQPKVLLAKTLIDLLKEQAASDDPNIRLATALLRALSGVGADIERRTFLLDLLTQRVPNKLVQNIECLVAISGRCWLDLKSEKLLEAFIENLVIQDQIAFNAVLSDLMMLPNMKEKILVILKGENKTKGLSKRVESFLHDFY